MIVYSLTVVTMVRVHLKRLSEDLSQAGGTETNDGLQMGEGSVLFAHAVAIIYIPPGHPLDGQLVLACMGHVIRRGYWLHTVLRDWTAVAAALTAGTAQVVVLATRTHRAGDADWLEVVDEEEIRMLRQRNAAVGRHHVPALPPDRRIADSQREALYETARLWPRGDDGGFAERFLEARRSSRHMSDT